MEDVSAVFGRSEPQVLTVYEAILKRAEALGPCTAEPKKTSIHLVRKTGFAGVHPQKAALVLNVRLARALPEGSRWKSEQVSKSRWHHEIKLTAPKDVDREVIAFLREAYELAG